MGLLPSFKMSNRRANMELQAGALAQSTLEELRASPFETLVSSSEPVKKGDLTFNREIVVTESSSGLSKVVRVNMTWDWKGQQFRTFRETIFAKAPRP